MIAVAIINIAVNIPQALLVWLQCSPVSALWDPLRQDRCDHRKNVYYNYFVGAIAALSDIYLAIVPIHMLLPLKIDRKLKWGLSFLMGCGVFAGAAAIVRTWAAKHILSDDSSCELLQKSEISQNYEGTNPFSIQMASAFFSAGAKLKNGLS